MYFDFEDNRPETPTVESAISRREGVLLSIVFHCVLLVAILNMPSLIGPALLVDPAAMVPPEREREEQPRFVFVQPRVDLEAPTPPPRAEVSDRDRVARAPERAPDPRNELPFALGNSPERTEAAAPAAAPTPSEPESLMTARDLGNDGGPEPGIGESVVPEAPDSAAAPLVIPDEGRRPFQRPPGGMLGQALRSLERYLEEESFDNPQGGGGQFGPSIQFDTMGVDFGPWIRRFVAQIKRNWFIPYAAMSMKGHVVITFNVHRDGSITDLSVPGPSSVTAFNNAAYNALAASNPTNPLPPEYPSDRAFFTVTFYYNESPPAP